MAAMEVLIIAVTGVQSYLNPMSTEIEEWPPRPE
jgi:hypothetical protein